MKKRGILRVLTMIGQYKVVKKGEGKGTFGDISLVTKPGNGDEVYALKKINLSKCGEKDQQHCQDEVTQLKESCHENVVKFIDSFKMENYLCIVMEYCKGGNLRQYIHSRANIIAEGEFLSLFLQICKGLKYLHDKNIAHRDIKTTNILLTEDNQIKIADFGLAKKVLMETVCILTKMVGSPYFMSPEMLKGQEYTTKTDIWSLACCMFEMGTKTILFTAQDVQSLKEKLHCTEKFPQLADKLPFCEGLKSLFCAMLQLDGMERPSADDLLNHLTSHSCQGSKQRVRSGPRHRKQDFSKTCPAKVLYQRPQDDSTSGVDTDASEYHEPRAVAVGYCKITTEIYVTAEQKESHELMTAVEKLILQKIGENQSLMSQLMKKIHETKHMETYKTFLESAKRILEATTYKKCELHLKSLWVYKTDLLKYQYQMA